MIRRAGDGDRRGSGSAPTTIALLGLGLVLILGTLPVGMTAARQEEPGAAGPVVGLGEPGDVAFAFTGRIERRASRLTLYGYMTHIAGLRADELFTDPSAPLAATARFTVFGTSSPLPRVALDDVEVATSVGELAIYYNPPAGGSFDAAESFFSGTKIATAATRFHDVLLGDPGAPRPVDVFAQIEVTETETFVLENGDEVIFGEPEARLRLLAAGVEPPEEEDSGRTTTTFAGTAFLVTAPSREALSPTEAPEPTPTEVTEPTATPVQPPPRPTPATDVDCEAIEPWLLGTLGRVARTRALVTPVLAVLNDDAADPFAEFDPAGLRDAAGELNELAAAQQDAAAPADVEAVDRLLVTAFQSFARGLNLLATAVANENESALDQARSLLADADAALTEGSQPLAELGAVCDIRR